MILSWLKLFVDLFVVSLRLYYDTCEWYGCHNRVYDDFLPIKSLL